MHDVMSYNTDQLGQIAKHFSGGRKVLFECDAFVAVAVVIAFHFNQWNKAVHCTNEMFFNVKN